MAFGKRIKEAREIRAMTQTELAAQVPGLSQQAIANSEQRDSQSSRFLIEIAQALQVNVNWLARGEGPRDSSQSNVTVGPDFQTSRQYPLISYVQAGAWTEVTDIYQPGVAETWLSCTKDLGPHGYVLRVKGDSMTNPQSSPSFPDGVLIFVKPECDCQPGDFVIAKREAENNATFKQLKLVDGELYLYAINPEWPTRYIKLQEGDRICGRVEFTGFSL